MSSRKLFLTDNSTGVTMLAQLVAIFLLCLPLVLLLPSVAMTVFKLPLVIQAVLLNVLPALVKVLEVVETFPLLVRLRESAGQCNGDKHQAGTLRLRHFHQT